MAKYCGTALPSMGEQCREQVNTGEDGSWELWGRVREPGSSISFGENLKKTNQNTGKILFKLFRKKFWFPVLLDCFSQLCGWQLAGGNFRSGRGNVGFGRVRKTLLVVGFPLLRTNRCPYQRISSNHQLGSWHASDGAPSHPDPDPASWGSKDLMATLGDSLSWLPCSMEKF